MEDYRLFDAEYRLMDIIWDAEPINSTELCRLCAQRLGWKKPTTYTMLRKLAGRGLLRNEGAVVTSLVGRARVRQQESRAVLERSFDNSLPAFVAAFLQDKTLSHDEARELKRLIEEAAKHEQ